MELISELFRAIMHNPLIFWLIVIAILLWLFTTLTTILGHWHHTFDNANFSALDCYTKIREGLAAREIPGQSSYRTTYRESVIFGAKREYLRVKRDDYIFDICVSPFGTSMFASWWFVDETTRIARFIRRLPIISYFYSHVTYHQLDSEYAFRDLVHLIVLEALDAMTETHGVRMTEYDRRIKEYPTINIRRR